ncbi:MAG: cytochrome c biogenesis protein CcsA, partial [Candidatus Thermoplasmatota archaeon]
MTLGLILLWLSLAFGAASLCATWRWPAAARLLSRAHAGAVIGAFVLLVVAFLTTDLSYAYVWGHTRADAPLPYKLAGVWGGEDGTVLLWNAGVALFVLLVQRAKGAVHARAALSLLGFSVALTLVQLASGAFSPSDALSLASHPGGLGLAEVLQTPLMVIHPPIQFVAYALMTVPAAYATALFTATTRDEEDAWISPAYRWARVAWLLATVGLGLGALWAYYVLSFGGYWAWDPVETSNLLPWLALTTFLHAGKHHEKFGDHPLSSPLLAVTASLLTLFATFATRSGLWVSVHAFTDPTGNFEPDAAARLLGIIAVHTPSRAFLALLTAALFAAMALFLRYHSIRSREGWSRTYLRVQALLLFALAGLAAFAPAVLWSWLFGAAALAPSMPLGMALVFSLLLGLPLLQVYLAREEQASKRKLDARLVMSVAVALFVVATAVAFLLNLQVINGPDRSVFDVRAPIVVLPMVSVLTVMMGLAPLGKRGALVLAGAGALCGLAAWALFPGARTLALSAPFLGAAAVATALKLAHVQGRSASPRLRVAGILILLASILGLVEASNPLTYVAGVNIPPGLSLASGFLGAALATVGLVGAVAAFRARGRAFAIAGSICAALAVGYGIGAMIALAGLVL